MKKTTTNKEGIKLWLAEPPHPDRRHLFCFPYAGGGAAVYRDWAAHLPPDIQLCPIELPGRGRRFGVSPFRNLSTLVASLGLVLHPHLHQPFAIFGHSMGALIGFELTRWLRSHQLPLPQHLFVSGQSAPSLQAINPAIHKWPDAQFMMELRRYGGTPAGVFEHPELMQVLLSTLRADFELLETYRYCPQDPLPCPITVAGGHCDLVSPPETLQAWQHETRSAFDIRLFSGQHFFLHDSVRALVDLCAQPLCREHQAVKGAKL